MNNNKWSHPGLKIFIEKQHPVLHSSALKPCFKSALRIDSVSSRCWRHRCWSLRAPLPLSFLFSVPPVSSRLNCFSFSSFSHCTFHCETLVFLNALLELSIPLAHFLSELFLPFRLTPTLLLMRKIWLRDMQCWLCCLPARPQNSGAWRLEMKCNTAILSSV